jgi:hypothetical protein
MDAEMWLGMVFPIDPGTAKDVAAVLGRRYGLFRFGIAGMASATAVIAVSPYFPVLPPLSRLPFRLVSQE